MRILSLLVSVQQAILCFFTAISLTFSSGADAINTYSARNPDELVMSFSLISDTHVETTSNDNYKVLIELLRSIKGGKNINAAVFLGDNVMNGQELESFYFYTALKKIKPSDMNLVALGNHDIGNGQGDYSKFVKRFLRYNEKYLDNANEKPYYYKVINGCYMIFLASEDLTVNTCYMSQTQIDWLKNVLDEAGSKNAPIFVFNHHPIQHIYGVEWGVLIDLLSGYDNLIYFAGHTHMELTEYSFRMLGSIKCVYLPRSVGDGYAAGDGIVIEVYPDEILLRSRNFIENRWIEGLEYKVTISK